VAGKPVDEGVLYKCPVDYYEVNLTHSFPLCFKISFLVFNLDYYTILFRFL